MFVRKLIALVALLGVTLAVYVPGLSGGFVFDDIPNIVENRDVQITSFDLDSILGAAQSSDSGMLRRPLSMGSFGLNYLLFGPAAYSFKFINILIHLGCGLAIYLLTVLLLRALQETRGPALAGDPQTVALFVTAIFALHPMQVTSVLYVVQRMTSLAALFVICGLIAYVAGRRALYQGNGRRVLVFFLFPAVFTVLAVLSKENGALLPLFAFAIEITVFRFRNHAGQIDRRVLWWHLGFTLLPVVAGIFALILNPERFVRGYALREFTLFERLLTEARAFVFYGKNLLAPSLSQLGLYHDDFVVSRGVLSPPATVLALIGIAGVAVGAWIARNRAPFIALGILWFFVGHLFESTILPLELVHEHRNYLPVFGLALCAVGIAGIVRFGELPRAIRIGLPVAFVGLLSLVTWMRANDWSNPFLHAESEIRHHPDSPRAVYEAGRLYANLALAGNPAAADPAFRHFARASTIDRSNALPDVGRIILAHKLAIPVEDTWLASLRSKYGQRPIAPGSIAGLMHLARCAAKEACVTSSQILPILNGAHKNPYLRRHARARADIATIYGEYLIKAHRDYAGGEEKFREAVQLAPGEKQYRVNLINHLIASARADEAAKEVDELRTIAGWGSGAQVERLVAKIARLRTWLAARP